MDNQGHTQEDIDAENDDLSAVAKKLGVEEYSRQQKIIPTERQLSRLNAVLDDERNTLLMRFVELGKSDVVEFLLMFDGLCINYANKKGLIATDIAWDEKRFDILLMLLRADAEFPYSIDKDQVDNAELKHFLEKRDKLHNDIESGDFKAVKDEIKDRKPSMYLNIKFEPYCMSQSAISWAAECKQVEIFAYLRNNGAKFKDSEEEDKCEFDEEERDRLNELLYFLKVENSHILHLLYRSQSPQPITAERWNMLKNLYDYLNRSEIISLMMKVLEYEDVDVVFDFESDHTNNIYCMNNRRIYGLTVPVIKKIFIGAKKCESNDDVCVEVAGTLAHELCHMAMEVLYRNDAKPYKNDDLEVSEYKSIVKKICVLSEKSPEMYDDAIKNVFDHYYEDSWDSEMIVRVPHILGLYGDEEGKEKLENQVKDLLDFFRERIVEKSKNYSNPAFFKKSLCIIESLHKYHGCINEVDKERNPLKIPCKPFEKELIRKGNVQVISTNSLKLCSLQIYHELKKTYRYHMDKCCLFFKLDCFLKSWEKIMSAFNCNVCHYLVLITNDRLINFDYLSTYFDNVSLEQKDKNDGKNVILIVSDKCENLGEHPGNKRMIYLWKDLSEDYKRECYHKMVNFKGKDTSLTRWLEVHEISSVIESGDMLRLIGDENIIIGDGMNRDSQGYDSYNYMERALVKETVERSVFKELDDKTAFYITGLNKEDSTELELNDEGIQWLRDPKGLFDRSKHIFIREPTGSVSFSNEFESIPVTSKHWLHYLEKTFHVVSLRGARDKIEKHLKKNFFTENELLELNDNRIVLIADDAGTGKSTLLTDLIRKMREDRPHCWVGRINLIDYAVGEENRLSLVNIKEESKPDEVLDVFFGMTDMNPGLDVYLLKQFTKPKGLKGKYMVFLDGYDEVASLYKRNVMKLIRTLIEETAIQLWITTRVHERVDLEVELGSSSFSLEQFSNEQQNLFLDKLWKQRMMVGEEIKKEESYLEAIERLGEKLDCILSENPELGDSLFVDFKNIRMALEDEPGNVPLEEKLVSLRYRIEGLNFREFASKVLERFSILDEKIEFTGIPLHLFMVGNVIYDKNLKADVSSNLYSLYSDFVEGKISIYWKEKLRITSIVGGTQNLLDNERRTILQFHMKIARKVKESMPISKEDLVDEATAVGVGILTKSGNNLKFIHQTFADFFFAKSFLEEIDCTVLFPVLSEDQYEIVRKFLCSALTKDDRKMKISKSFSEKLYSLFLSFAHKGWSSYGSTFQLLGKILEVFEARCAKEDIDEFVAKIANVLYIIPYEYDPSVFFSLRYCLTAKMQSILFEKHTEAIFQSIFAISRFGTATGISDSLGYLKVMLAGKSNPEIASDASVDKEKVECNPPTSETDRYKEMMLKLVQYRDEWGNSILHIAALNSSSDVFLELLGLVEGLINPDLLKAYISEKNEDGFNIMHCSAIRGARSMPGILTSVKGKVSVVDLLTELDGRGRNVFHLITKNVECPYQFRLLLEVAGHLEEGKTAKRLLLQGDKTG